MKDVSTGTQNAPDQGTYAIELRDVTKRFLTPAGKAYTAIRDINMAGAPGGFVAVVWPTGCRKSTTLGLIFCLARPSARGVEAMGEAGPGLDPRLCYVFQAASVVP